MAKVKRIKNPVKIDFWIDVNVKALFEDKFYDAKKLDRGLTRGEFFARILTGMYARHDGTTSKTSA